MGKDTSISWADCTFNPWWGCDKVSPACDHCYAQAWAQRLGMDSLWNGERRFFGEGHWQEPRRWNDAARKAGKRARVFCASMADVFDNHEALPRVRERLWQLIRETSYLDWMLLTKRIGNARSMLPPDWGDGYSHVWLGATVINQEEADRDIPKLLSVPAAVRFLSCEPLLGPLDLNNVRGQCWAMTQRMDALTGEANPSLEGIAPKAKLDWVIAGGESGSKARPTHPDWFRSLRDQCASAGVAFHFKQHGEWLPGTQYEQAHRDADPDDVFSRFRSLEWNGQAWVDSDPLEPTGNDVIYRVGAQLAGRTLDGRVWDEFPREVA